MRGQSESSNIRVFPFRQLQIVSRIYCPGETIVRVSATILLPAYRTWKQDPVSISMIQRHQVQEFNGNQFCIHAKANS